MGFFPLLAENHLSSQKGKFGEITKDSDKAQSSGKSIQKGGNVEEPSDWY